MPLYEYQCAGCGAAFERLRRMQDADQDQECPQCASHEVKRLLSTFAPHTASPGGGAEALAPCGQPASACGNGRCPGGGPLPY
ncbi:MAG: zinc ribbon domain-containing protein [Bryobacteraceae bacterium]|jgi:putative FmdB family regulatory protein